MTSSEPPLSLPAEMLRELDSAGLNPGNPPTLEQWQTLLLRFAHRFREEPSPMHFPSSALGHELRTPMTVVMGATELLLESDLDPLQRQAAQNVHRSSQDLLEVIDKLLSDVTDVHGSGPPRALTPAGTRLTSNTGRRVLLAEDNEFNRTLVERALRTLECQVDVAASGREAVRKFRNNAYDLILMDCHMPDVDGLEATRQIRASEGAHHRVPIIAVTAGNVPGAREDCLLAGMDDFIAKPFSLAKLRRRVSHWLSASAASPGRPALSELPPQPPQDQSAGEGSATSIDLSRLHELASEAGSPRIVEELSLIFVQDMERRLESLREAIAIGSDRSLLALLHSIKGACGNFGAIRMAALAEQMERETKRGGRAKLTPLAQELTQDFVVVRGLLDAEVFGIRPVVRADAARRASG
ncbi:MAG TPA: response regulator [Polyangiaceae bacterium]